MRAMLKTNLGTHLALAAAALLSGLACRKPQQPGGPPAPLVQRLELKPAAAARANLVAEVTIANFDRTLSSVGAVAKKLNLPFNEADLRKMAIARSGAPEALVESIDRSKPASAAIILVNKKGEDGTTRESAEPVIAMALKSTDKAGFDAFANLTGKVVERSKDAVKVNSGDASGFGKAWLLYRDGAVCLAEELDRLVAGCELALQARKATDQDLRVTVLPEGIARASGTTLKEALAKMRANMITAQQQAASAAPPRSKGKGTDLEPSWTSPGTSLQMAQSILGWFLDAIADTAEGRIGLGLDPTKGLSTTFQVVPRPGSALAKTVANRRAYAVDPAIASGAPGSVWAMGDTSFTKTIFDSIRGPFMESIKSEAERAKANASIDALFEALSGPFSGRFSFEGAGKMPFTYDVVYNLKAGADPKKVIADLESVMKAPWLTSLFDAAFQGMMKVKVTSKREGEALVNTVAFDTKKMPADMRKQLKNMPLFDRPIEARSSVAGERMFVAIGPSGTTKARLGTLAGPGAPPSADVAAAMAETKGEDAFYYSDLAAVMRPFLTAAAAGAKGQDQATMMMGALGGMLQNSVIATWGSYRGGETATVTWRIPGSTFDAIGKIVGAMMGGGMR
jgi:hypothetical protein